MPKNMTTTCKISTGGKNINRDWSFPTMQQCCQGYTLIGSLLHQSTLDLPCWFPADTRTGAGETSLIDAPANPRGLPITN